MWPLGGSLICFATLAPTLAQFEGPGGTTCFAGLNVRSEGRSEKERVICHNPLGLHSQSQSQLIYINENHLTPGSFIINILFSRSYTIFSNQAQPGSRISFALKHLRWHSEYCLLTLFRSLRHLHLQSVFVVHLYWCP